MNQDEFHELIARASRLPKTARDSRKQDEWDGVRAYDGAINLKRRALGICGTEAFRTEDEMARLLYEVNLADSIDKARELAPRLVGYGIDIGGNRNPKMLEILRGKGPNDERGYVIMVCSSVYA